MRRKENAEENRIEAFAWSHCFFKPDPFPVDDAFRELYIWNRKHSDDLRCPRNCVANDGNDCCD